MSIQQIARRGMMGSAGSGNMVHLHTYTHTDSSWQDTANGNATSFKSTYAQDCTENGLYIFVVTNNNVTSNPAYAAIGAIKNVNVFGTRTDWVFQRNLFASTNDSTSTWMLMNAGAIIDVYYISKDTLVGA